MAGLKPGQHSDGNMLLPRLVNCVAALIFSALAPATLYSILVRDFLLAPTAFLIAAGHALLLGLPVFIKIEGKGKFNVITSLIAGAAIGALPIGLITFPLSPFGGSSSTNGIPMVVDGIPTLAGWIGYFEFLLYPTAFGVAGGFAFWLTIRAAELFAKSVRSEWMRNLPGLGLIVLALSVAGGGLTTVETQIDKTCHNMLRDGRSTVSPRVRMYLEIAPEDVPRMVEVFETVGQAHHMVLRNKSDVRPDIVDITSLSLCNDLGLNISVNSQRWSRMTVP